ncbi:hypothetical protein V1512DRAFT_121974 [Lipomyces arxii]|uniref:uncharacterized protein n=1 Tax=Lipomyces arxii TaxID=56418 RepID=UPI0034CD96FA
MSNYAPLSYSEDQQFDSSFDFIFHPIPDLFATNFFAPSYHMENDDANKHNVQSINVYSPSSAHSSPGAGPVPTDLDRKRPTQRRRPQLTSSRSAPTVKTTSTSSTTASTTAPLKNEAGKFQCNECTRSYLHAKHLKRHKLRHTGNRPYKCSLCADSFCRSDILKRHFEKCAHRKRVAAEKIAVATASQENKTQHACAAAAMTVPVVLSVNGNESGLCENCLSIHYNGDNRLCFQCMHSSIQTNAVNEQMVYTNHEPYYDLQFSEEMKRDPIPLEYATADSFELLPSTELSGAMLSFYNNNRYSGSLISSAVSSSVSSPESPGKLTFLPDQTAYPSLVQTEWDPLMPYQYIQHYTEQMQNTIR